MTNALSRVLKARQLLMDRLLDKRNFIFSSAITGLGIFSGVGGRAIAQAKIGIDYNSQRLTVDYAKRDFEIVDYEFYELPSLPGISFRGPYFNPEDHSEFFTCIGAAQTLGVYVQDPYPQQLSRKLGMPAWNVGLGGASPRFFAENDKIIDFANRGKFVIFQVMTARSEPNDRFAPRAGVEFLHDKKRNDTIITIEAWNRIVAEEPAQLKSYVDQSRRSWERNSRYILSKIKVPVILFWFSPKNPLDELDLTGTQEHGFIDVYPQFINHQNIEALRSIVQEYVTCFSDRNQGHRLTSRFTGKPTEITTMLPLPEFRNEGDTTHNLYYPSHEMHVDATEALARAIETDEFMNDLGALK